MNPKPNLKELAARIAPGLMIRSILNRWRSRQLLERAGNIVQVSELLRHRWYRKPADQREEKLQKKAHIAAR